MAEIETSAWVEIKKIIVNGRPGSMGAMLDLEKAVDVFLVILPFLKNRKFEEGSFNADDEVFELICNKKQLAEIRGIVDGR